MLKAKFSLTCQAVMPMIERHNSKCETPDVFIVEPVKYNDKQCIVVGAANPVMYLIGECAAAGFDSLMDVTSL